MAKITDLMVSDLITVDSNATAQFAATQMKDNRVGAVIVIDSGAISGILSERDVVARVIAEGKDPATTRVAEIATHAVVTVQADAPIRAVLDTFREHRFRHLPVLEGATVVGILSTRDFLAFLVDGLERLMDDAHYREQLAANEDPYDHVGGGYGR